jgi:hypothetical protein
VDVSHSLVFGTKKGVSTTGFVPALGCKDTPVIYVEIDLVSEALTSPERQTMDSPGMQGLQR